MVKNYSKKTKKANKKNNTKTNKKTSRKTNKKKKRYKGGGNKDMACHKYRNPNASLMPIAQTTEETNDTNEEYYKKIYDTILRNDGNGENFLILKIGSNDSANAIREGSRGEDGFLFWETQPFPTGKPATELLDMRNSNNLYRQLVSFAKKGNDVKLIAISPVEEYVNFEYPFINKGESSGPEEITKYFNYKHNFQHNKTYIQSYFPVGVNPNPDSYNYKILKYLSERPGPLLLFNAMGSWCYSSIKYILDMRIIKGFRSITAYAGLVDVKYPPNVSCEFGIPIYPTPEIECPA